MGRVGRIGRAMLQPVYAQKVSRDGAMGTALEVSMIWWRAVLNENITEVRPWALPAGEFWHLFVDAATTPPKCAAVLFANRRIYYTDATPPVELMNTFKVRGDKQVTTLVSLVCIFIDAWLAGVLCRPLFSGDPSNCHSTFHILARVAHADGEGLLGQRGCGASHR